MRENIAELSELRRLAKISADRQDDLTTIIKDYVENQEGSIKHNAQLLALIKEKVRTGIDSKLLKAKFPEAAEACAKTSFYLTIDCV